MTGRAGVTFLPVGIFLAKGLENYSCPEAMRAGMIFLTELRPLPHGWKIIPALAAWPLGQNG